MMDKYIFSKYVPAGEDVDVRASLSFFPLKSYHTDNFHNVIAGTLSIFLSLSYVFPVSVIIQALVLEKEQRVKEGMKMMGLTDFMYNLSWLITLFVQLTLLALITSVIAQFTVFPNTTFALIFIYFEAFTLATMSFCFLAASVFSRAKFAAFIGPMLFFALSFPGDVVSSADYSTKTKLGMCVFPQSCFAIVATNVFSVYEGGGVGLHWDDVNKITQNFSYTLAVSMILADAVAYALLAWYLDKALPSEYGTPLPWYFPVMPSFWCGVRAPAPAPMGDSSIHGHNPLVRAIMDPEKEALRDFDTSDKESKQEIISSDLRQQCQDGRAVRIQKLRKEWKGQGNSVRVAVNDLGKTFYINSA